MTATVQLFPSFFYLSRRLKRLLATDISPLWYRFSDACEADAERSQRKLEEKGLGDFNPLGYPFF